MNGSAPALLPDVALTGVKHKGWTTDKTHKAHEKKEHSTEGTRVCMIQQRYVVVVVVVTLKDLPDLHSPVEGHLMRMSSVVTG